MDMLSPKSSEWEKTPFGTHPQEISEHQRKKTEEVPRNSQKEEHKKFLFKGWYLGWHWSSDSEAMPSVF